MPFSRHRNEFTALSVLADLPNEVTADSGLLHDRATPAFTHVVLEVRSEMKDCDLTADH